MSLLSFLYQATRSTFTGQMWQMGSLAVIALGVALYGTSRLHHFRESQWQPAEASPIRGEIRVTGEGGCRGARFLYLPLVTYRYEAKGQKIEKVLDIHKKRGSREEAEEDFAAIMREGSVPIFYRSDAPADVYAHSLPVKVTRTYTFLAFLFAIGLFIAFAHALKNRDNLATPSR